MCSRRLVLVDNGRPNPNCSGLGYAKVISGAKI